MRVSSLDSLRRYLQIQLAVPVHGREPPQPSITISREAGGGSYNDREDVSRTLKSIQKTYRPSIILDGV